jgi:hypothetical protein
MAFRPERVDKCVDQLGSVVQSEVWCQIAKPAAGLRRRSGTIEAVIACDDQKRRLPSVPLLRRGEEAFSDRSGVAAVPRPGEDDALVGTSERSIDLSPGKRGARLGAKRPCRQSIDPLARSNGSTDFRLQAREEVHACLDGAARLPLAHDRQVVGRACQVVAQGVDTGSTKLWMYIDIFGDTETGMRISQLRRATQDKVYQGICPRGRDRRVLLQIPRRREHRVGVAPLSCAVAHIVEKGVELACSYVGILKQVPGALEQDTGFRSLISPDFEIMTKRIETGRLNGGVPCQVPIRIEQNLEIATLPDRGTEG